MNPRTLSMCILSTMLAGVVLVATLVLTGCGAQLGTTDSLDPNDKLYAKVKSVCGDALMVRVLESDDEALCCVFYENWKPRLECMTSDDVFVVNPPSAARLKRG